MAQAMKEDMAENKSRGGIMNGMDVNMKENVKMADSTLDDAYEIYKFDMMEQGLEPMSIEQFRDQAISESQMSSNNMEDIKGQTAGPQWYYDRIQALEFEFGDELTEEEIAEIAYDSDKFYDKMGYDPVEYKKGGRVNRAEGGLMNLGGKEMDLRGGGFVPMGKAERADDVPARLSKNEFVMTADAVRAAGGGSVQKGADLMYDQMKQLERQA